MSQLRIGHEHQPDQEPFKDQHAAWHTDVLYTPSHQSLVQDYNGFTSYPILSMEPIYGTSMHPPHQTHPTPRTTHPQPQPLIMPQIPQSTMLTCQSAYPALLFLSAPPSITSTSTTPVSATLTQSRISSTPRKTFTFTGKKERKKNRKLTKEVRRRMCQFYENNPITNHAEIGKEFNVERSTVSEILLQKWKYRYQDNSSQPPIESVKENFPYIGHELSEWGINHQSDSKVEELEANSNPPLNAHTPVALPPTPPGSWISPATGKAKKIEENLRKESLGIDNFSTHRRPLHQQSNTYLSSVSTNTAPSTFSAGPTSLTSLSSSFEISQEEAAYELEFVMEFLQSQDTGLVIEPQDYATINKLIERLRTKR